MLAGVELSVWFWLLSKDLVVTVPQMEVDLCMERTVITVLSNMVDLIATGREPYHNPAFSKDTKVDSKAVVSVAGHLACGCTHSVRLT